MTSPATSSLGKPPELSWVDKHKLKVDRSYQRELGSERSQKVIARIAENFCWLKFGVLTTTQGFDLVDGQHRHAAALRRDDVTQLPCLRLPIKDAAAAAAIFVSINRDRTALTPQAIFKAELAAGVPEAMLLRDLAQDAGAEVLSYPLAKGAIKPHQTNAVSTLRWLYAKDKTALQDALAACVQSGVGLTAVAIKAAFRAVGEGAHVGTVVAQLASMRGVAVDQQDVSPGGRAETFFRMMTGAIAKPAPEAAPAKTSAPAMASKGRKPFQFDRLVPAVPSDAPQTAEEMRAERERALARVKPRRFEMGASGDDFDYQLRRFGFACKKAGTSTSSYMVTRADGAGRGRTMSKAELISFIDKQRTAVGLEPIAKRKGAI